MQNVRGLCWNAERFVPNTRATFVDGGNLQENFIQRVK